MLFLEQGNVDSHQEKWLFPHLKKLTGTDLFQAPSFAIQETQAIATVANDVRWGIRD